MEEGGTMTTKENLEIVLSLAQASFYFASAVAVSVTFLKYITSVRQRTAETLMELEKRFEGFKDIVRLIDPASGRYDRDLRPALQKSLDPAKPAKTEQEENAIVQLDEFLRFLVLLGSLKENRLLSKKSLAHMYHYWFTAIDSNNDIKRYIGEYFKVLNKFLEDHRKTFWELSGVKA